MVVLLDLPDELLTLTMAKVTLPTDKAKFGMTCRRLIRAMKTKHAWRDPLCLRLNYIRAELFIGDAISIIRSERETETETTPCIRIDPPREKTKMQRFLKKKPHETKKLERLLSFLPIIKHTTTVLFIAFGSNLSEVRDIPILMHPLYIEWLRKVADNSEEKPFDHINITIQDSSDHSFNTMQMLLNTQPRTCDLVILYCCLPWLTNVWKFKSGDLDCVMSITEVNINGPMVYEDMRFFKLLQNVNIQFPNLRYLHQYAYIVEDDISAVSNELQKSAFSNLERLFQQLNRFRVEAVRGTRRTTAIAPWLPPSTKDSRFERATPANQQFIEQSFRDVDGQITSSPFTSPLVQQPWQYEQRQAQPNSRRCGLLVKKIGVMPHWLKTGQMVQTTMLQVLNTQVIEYTDPDTWYKQSIAGKKKAFRADGLKYGRLLIGADNDNPTTYTPAYRRKFERLGIPIKRHIAAFPVTPDARIQPGTRLVAAHFSVGQLVAVVGRTIDWGFEGVIHRWGMHGGKPDVLGTTKSHRRVGSIASSGQANVLPGKRLPGHMGWEIVSHVGIKILRIDHRNQIIYVLGPGIQGDQGEVLRLYDYISSTRKNVKYDTPPFPTYLVDEDNSADDDLFAKDVHHDSLHCMTDPSIHFELGVDQDFADVLKKATVKKQAKVRKK